MAIDTLRQYAGNNTKAEVKLWADLGEFKTAASLCSRISPHDIRSYLMGEIFRLQGDYQKALSYFQQTIAVKKSSSSRRYDQYVKRARSAAAAIKLFELLDLRRVPNGVYRDKSTGYAGDVQIEATIRGGRIIGLKVTRHREKQYYASLTDTPARIIKKQSLKGISATTGATLTSEAIINATAKALAGGQR